MQHNSEAPSEPHKVSGVFTVVTGLPAVVPHLAVLQALHLAVILMAVSLRLPAQTIVSLRMHQQCVQEAVSDKTISDMAIVEVSAGPH